MAGELLARWCRTIHHPEAAPAGRDVLARYGEPHRRYHTPEHLTEVLAMTGDLIDLARLPEAVELAAWLHDVIYDPQAPPGVNEDASARYGEMLLGSLAVPALVAAEAARLIRLTASHAVGPGDVDGAILMDADLWILGASRERYRRYAVDVRAEYAWLDDDAWVTGRSAVLRSFANRARLYVTDRADAALDARARRNLAWELAALSGRQPQA